ncbi:hypothetical protein [Amycolatopsis sp. lyj-112]|uniref:hypothetical protein n=1 Tax=Amycolatopsis sp. lyj-112 TaxID=2789288 RepID=UPI00397DC7E8
MIPYFAHSILGDGFQFRLVEGDVVDRDVVPVGGEPQCDSLPDSSGGTGGEDVLAHMLAPLFGVEAAAWASPEGRCAGIAVGESRVSL